MRLTGEHRIAVALAIVVIAAGCDTQVAPFTDEFEAPVHVVDGFLDGSATVQRVRIQKLRRTEEQPAPVLGEFEVASVAVGVGIREVWQDSLITLADGSRAHQFSAAFSPRAGVRYQLTVSDVDAQTAVSTTIPDEPLLSRLVTIVTTTVVQPVALSGLSEPPPNLSVKYVVVEPEDGSRHVFDFTYTTPGRNRQNGWEFDVFLSADRVRIGNALGRPDSDTALVLESVTIDFELLSTEWSELEQPVRQPGFFGSIGSFSLPLEVDASVRATLGVQ